MIPAIEFLLARGVDVNHVNNTGETALFAAAYGGMIPAIEFLLTREEVNINHPNNRGETALFAAALSGRIVAMEFLLERGMDIDHVSQFGGTALRGACNNNNLEVATLLINRGADVNLSLLEAFVRQDEWGQINEIINNRPQEPAVLHLEQGRDTEILNLLVFPNEFQNSVDLIGNDDNHIALNFEPEFHLK